MIYLKGIGKVYALTVRFTDQCFLCVKIYYVYKGLLNLTIWPVVSVIELKIPKIRLTNIVHPNLRYIFCKKSIKTSYTVFPHIVSAETFFFEFGNPKVTVHKVKCHST